MGLGNFINQPEGNEEEEDNEHVDGGNEPSLKHYRDTVKFIRDFSPKGFYIGPEPPGKFDTPKIPEEDWCDEWQDKTGEFEYYQPKPDWAETGCKKTTCQCGATVNMWITQRQWQCRECRRWVIDREWEDDRIQNPNTKEDSGLNAFL